MSTTALNTDTALNRLRIMSTDTTLATREVPIGQLCVYGRVQRTLDTRRAQKMADALNPDAIGVITVNARPDGTLSVVDGQHRLAALRLSGGNDHVRVLCHIHRGLSEADEAILFRQLNDSTKVTAADLFRVGVVAGDAEAVAVNAILQKHGLRVAMSFTTNSISCIKQLVEVYRGVRIKATEPQPEVLDMLLTLLDSAWNGHKERFHRDLVAGMGSLLLRHHDSIDTAALTKLLAGWHGGPVGLLGDARGIRAFRGGAIGESVAEVVVDRYNYRRTTRRLPLWRSA